MDIYERLREMGIKLPPPLSKGGVYVSTKTFGEKLVYISGCGPNIGEQHYIGKLGSELTVRQGQMAAKNCMLNILSVLHNEIGDLNQIKSFVKVLVFVASTPDFYEQPAVANGATAFLAEAFGEKIGIPTRSAIACNVLPGNIAVEVEGIVELF